MSRLCPSKFSLLLFPSKDGSGPPLLPPPRFTRFPCPVQFARILFIFPLLPLLHQFLCIRPSTSSSVWSDVTRPAEVSKPPADFRPMPSPGFLSSVPYESLPPPDLCCWRYLVRVWIGGRSRRLPPRWYWVPQRVDRPSVPLVNDLGPSSMLVVPVSLCPPHCSSKWA